MSLMYQIVARHFAPWKKLAAPTAPALALSVRVWRPETRHAPLREALPVRTGDELQVRFRVPAGLHVGLFSVHGLGQLVLLQQYSVGREAGKGADGGAAGHGLRFHGR
jgi:hypothetical protein